MYNPVAAATYGNFCDAVPKAPTTLIAITISRTEVNLHWSSADATSFQVERSPDGLTLWTNITVVEEKEYTDKDLQCNTTYYYRVAALNLYGMGAYSEVVSAITDACIVPMVKVELKSKIP